MKHDLVAAKKFEASHAAPVNESSWAIVCYHQSYRLRLADGRHIFMAWHHYLGPSGFYKDRLERRVIENWWEDQFICDALDWFCHRGNRC